MQLSGQQIESYDQEAKPPGILCPVLGQARTNEQPVALCVFERKYNSKKVSIQIFYDHLFIVGQNQHYCITFDFQVYLEYDLAAGSFWLQHKQTKSRETFSTPPSEQLQNFISQLKRRCPQQGFHQKFTLLQQASNGNNSKTCICKRISDDEVLAVKIQNNSSRVEKQIHILTQIQHPNLIFMREFFIQHDGTVYIIMDYQNGGNLLERLKLEKGLKYFDKLKVVIDMINALQFLRIKGIVHRDIKPENIVFSKKDGNYKICDFGLAVQEGTKINKVSGTPGYIAPQLFQITGDSIQAEISQDIYSMGLTFYQIFTQNQYYKGSDDQQILSNNVKALSFRKRSYISQDPEKLQKKLLQKMIRTSPCDRKSSLQIMQSTAYNKINRTYNKLVKNNFCGQTKSKSSSSDDQNMLNAVKRLLRIQTN